MKNTHLLAALTDIEPRFESLNARAVPSSFDAEDPLLRAFPLPFSYRWDTLAGTLAAWKPRAVMLRVPPLWQLEPLAREACRTVPAPIHCNDPANMPAGRAALAAAPFDTIVTEATSAADFLEHLVEHGARIPPNWMLIYSLHAAAWDAPHGVRKHARRISREVHFVPGVPLLHQQPHKHFERTRHFDWDGNTISNADAAWPVRISRFPLPFSAERYEIV